MNTTSDPSLCANKLINTEYQNGRISFSYVLTARDKSTVVISFSGIGKQQIHMGKDSVSQPIDRVTFTLNGSTDNLKASGKCVFSNPFKGTPAKVSCSADTGQGGFAGDFITDGTSPSIDKI